MVGDTRIELVTPSMSRKGDGPRSRRKLGGNSASCTTLTTEQNRKPRGVRASLVQGPCNAARQSSCDVRGIGTSPRKPTGRHESPCTSADIMTWFMSLKTP